MVARRPLNTEEMREALSVVPGNTNWYPQRLPHDIHGTVGCCAGLLVIDEEDFSIHMVHHSVRTFLLNDYRSIEGFSVERAHQRMDSVVLTFLNYEIFSKQVTSSKALKISAGAVASSTLGSMTRFLGGKQAQRLALKLLRVNGKLDRDIGPALASVIGNFRENRVLTALEFHDYAATWWPQHIWHRDLSDRVTNHNFSRLLGLVDLRITDACWRTPLSYAAEHGKATIASDLVAHGALDTPDTNGNTPLIWAVKAGHSDVIEGLINSRVANLTMRDSFGRTPLALVLALAAKNAYIALLLVVEMKHIDHFGVPLIIQVARKNFGEGVELLLDTTVVNLSTSVDHDRNTLLHFAAAFGNMEIIDILLGAYAADANAMNKEQKTSLWLAPRMVMKKTFSGC
ncbi:ankyrin repeat domain-containing protein [Aspergillus stella-maris]|uniref:ankyrin repeat domain-containing protein n=1 Tax=Aspergillus stella-maris TaxID=1810926 RepID=UPI003CCD09EB